MSEKKKCFVISPIGDPETDTRIEADWVLDLMIKPALEADYVVVRADAFPKINIIAHEVINAIRNADLVVADLTGHNPNVFYELAIAHAFHTPVIPLMRDGGTIPFDNAPMGTIFYSRAVVGKWKAAVAEIKAAASEAAKEGYKVSNPITSAIGQEKAYQSGDDATRMIANLRAEMEEFKSAVLSHDRSYPSPSHINIAAGVGKSVGIARLLADSGSVVATNDWERAMVEIVLEQLRPAIKKLGSSERMEMAALVLKRVKSNGFSLSDVERIADSFDQLFPELNPPKGSK